VLTIRAMTGGEGYAQRHLQQSDYYDQNRTVKGQWHGRGAELLGLKGEVTSEDFEAVRQGLDPRSGEFRRQRHSTDRIASNGAEQSKARSLYDMIFSAAPQLGAMAHAFQNVRLSCGSAKQAKEHHVRLTISVNERNRDIYVNCPQRIAA
jgi:conjugative relaxase-like TrwC/TraI family protein